MLGSTTNGSYAQYVVAPAANAVVLPESLSYEEARFASDRVPPELVDPDTPGGR